MTTKKSKFNLTKSNLILGVFATGLFITGLWAQAYYDIMPSNAMQWQDTWQSVKNKVNLSDDSNVIAADAESALSKPLQNVAAFLAKKHRVAQSETEKMVLAAVLAGKESKLDPMLILAVMSVESGLHPIIESSAGAVGLMQIMPKIHAAKFKALGASNFFEIEPNVRVGADIIKQCMALTDKTIEGGLKCYVGATGPTDNGYGAKVLNEQSRIANASLGKYDYTSAQLLPANKAVDALAVVDGEKPAFD